MPPAACLLLGLSPEGVSTLHCLPPVVFELVPNVIVVYMLYRNTLLLTHSFENSLKDILRGVDPILDPSTLPATAQSHISNVNSRGGGGLQIRAPPGGNLDHARKDVAAIKRRMKMIGPDAGTPAGPDDTDLTAILNDGYPASSAKVVAALTRR